MLLHSSVAQRNLFFGQEDLIQTNSIQITHSFSFSIKYKNIQTAVQNLHHALRLCRRYGFIGLDYKDNYTKLNHSEKVNC